MCVYRGFSPLKTMRVLYICVICEQPVWGLLRLESDARAIGFSIWGRLVMTGAHISPAFYENGIYGPEPVVRPSIRR